MTRTRYIGWVVICCDPAARADRVICRCDSQQEAAWIAAILNRAALADHPGHTWGAGVPLYWPEWWSTSSQLERREMPPAQVRPRKKGMAS